MVAWQKDLLPASFRGVPFFFEETGQEGGRRLAVTEFPLREDDGFPEDLGKKTRAWQIRGYVLGDDYFAQRDKLLAALEQPGIGTLVHPYQGPVQVRAGLYRLSETQGEGRLARFDMQFVPAGTKPSPVSTQDTAGAATSAADDANTGLGFDFTGRYDLANQPESVQGPSLSLVGDFAASAGGALEGLPGLDLAALSAPLGFLSGVAGTVVAVADIATNVIAVFTAVVDAVATAGSAVQALVASATEFSSRGAAGIADKTYGLGAFASYGTALPPVQATTAARVQQARNQQAFVDLVRGAATIAIARLFAATDFASANDAEAARDQVTGFIDAQSAAAAAAGDDALCLAWDLLYSAVALDLTVRGKSLPDILTYRTASPLPALALAYRLYQDATRAPELVARNAAVDPAFMPMSGEALST